MKQLTTKSAERLEQFEIASAAHHNAVDFALASHSRRIETSLGDGLARFEGAIDGRGREIIGQIGDRSAALAADLGAKLAAIEETLVNRGGAIDEKLGRRNEEAAALFDGRLQAVEERAGAKLHEVSSTLESLLVRIEDALAQRGRALTETLARNTLETAKALGDGGREIAARHERQIGGNRRDAAKARRRADANAVDGRPRHQCDPDRPGRGGLPVARRQRRSVQGPGRRADAGPEPALRYEPGGAGGQGRRSHAASHGMLDMHKASIGAAFDSHKAVVADATRQSAQIFDARLAALAEAADQSARIIDLRLADLAEAANRNAESIDERLAARIQAMSEVLARTASEAEFDLGGARRQRRQRDQSEGRRPARGHRRQGRRPGGRPRRAWRGCVGEDRWRRRARDADPRPADGEPCGLLTRRTDELIAAVNGSAADPVRALSALTGQLRSEVADSSETLRSVAAETHSPLGRDDRRVAEAVDRAGRGVRRLACARP